MVTDRKDTRRHLWPRGSRTMGSLKMTLKAKEIFTMVLSHYQTEMEKSDEGRKVP